MKKYFIIAQKASPITRWGSYRQSNLVFTSFPHYIDLLKSKGIKTEYLKLAFGRRVLDVVLPQKKKYDCTFIGGLSKHHSKGLELLSEVANNVNIDFFGYGKEILDKHSNIYKKHHGQVWGKDMYIKMMQSKITINRHINVAANYANNMRLYESTGSGTMLITDQKDNLKDFFEEDKEIVVYNNVNELIDKIKYYLGHDDIREKIAKLGQQRTLKEHNFTVRMKQMLNILEKYV